MATWIWIVIGVAAVAAIALGVVMLGSRKRNVERRRAEARILRQEADERKRRADEKESVAKEISGQAHEERHLVRKLEERAAKLDPATGQKGHERGRERDTEKTRQTS
jgi:uncharacterized protein HemX